MLSVLKRLKRRMDTCLGSPLPLIFINVYEGFDYMYVPYHAFFCFRVSLCSPDCS